MYECTNVQTERQLLPSCTTETHPRAPSYALSCRPQTLSPPHPPSERKNKVWETRPPPFPSRPNPCDRLPTHVSDWRSPCAPGQTANPLSMVQALIDGLQEQVDALSTERDIALTDLQASRAQIEQLEQQQSSTERALPSAERIMQRMRSSHRAQLDEKDAFYQEQIRVEQAEHQQQAANHQAELETQAAAHQENLEARVDQLVSAHQTEIERMRNEHQTELQAQQAAFDERGAGYDSRILKCETDLKDLMDKYTAAIDEKEAEMQQLKAEHAAKVQRLKVEHSSALTQLRIESASLDTTIAGQKQKIAKLTSDIIELKNDDLDAYSIQERLDNVNGQIHTALGSNSGDLSADLRDAMLSLEHWVPLLVQALDKAKKDLEQLTSKYNCFRVAVEGAVSSTNSFDTLCTSVEPLGYAPPGSPQLLVLPSRLSSDKGVISPESVMDGALSSSQADLPSQPPSALPSLLPSRNPSTTEHEEPPAYQLPFSCPGSPNHSQGDQQCGEPYEGLGEFLKEVQPLNKQRLDSLKRKASLEQPAPLGKKQSVSFELPEMPDTSLLPLALPPSEDVDSFDGNQLAKAIKGMSDEDLSGLVQATAV